MFAEATRHFMRDTGFNVAIIVRDAPPDLSPETSFNDLDSYREIPSRLARSRDVRTAVVSESGRVIGYGIALVHTTYSEIEIINVDEYSRRGPTGLQRQLELGDTFGVGVGHVVANLLIETIPRPILTKATNAGSRYIFKSLGFVQRPRTRNHDLLYVPKPRMSRVRA